MGFLLYFANKFYFASRARVSLNLVIYLRMITLSNPSIFQILFRTINNDKSPTSTPRDLPPKLEAANNNERRWSGKKFFHVIIICCMLGLWILSLRISLHFILYY